VTIMWLLEQWIDPALAGTHQNETPQEHRIARVTQGPLFVPSRGLAAEEAQAP
jgi:hypothetical protein